MPTDWNDLITNLLNPATPLGALIWGILIGLIAWLAGRAVGLAVHRILQRSQSAPADQTAVRFLGQLARLLVYIFAFLTYAHLIPALKNLGTAWLASVGVVSVVIGMAAQNTLSNLIAGISLLLYRPFRLGDTLQVNTPTGVETGMVESLNLGYTVLRTGDNRFVVLPNSIMASQININLSMGGRKLCVVNIAVSYRADLDKTRAILIEIAKAHPKVLECAGCPLVSMKNLTARLSLNAWCADVGSAGDVQNDILEAAKKRLQAEGIELR